jgi:hypothetical protein
MVGGPTPQTIATGGSAPVLAAGPDGSVLVGWWDNERTLTRNGTGEYDLVTRVWNPTEGTWSEPDFIHGARSENNEATAVAGPEGFVLVYTDNNRHMHALYRPYGANGWTLAGEVPDRAGARAFEPSLVAGPQGQILLTWRSFLQGSPNQVGAALYDGVGRFLPLPLPPATDRDLFRIGGAFNSEGAPVLFFDDGEVRQGCAGTAISDLIGAEPLAPAT